MRLYSFLLCRRFCVLMDKPRANMARSTAPVPISTASISVAHSPNTEMEEIMTTINLRDYYPFYTHDYFIDVPDEVAELFKEFDRKEAAYRLRTYRHKAYYSLDRNDGIEHEALFVSLSPMNCMSARFPCRSFMPPYPVCRTNRRNVSMPISFLT